MNSSKSFDKKALRKEMRERRRRLSHRQQQLAGENLARILVRQPFLLRARHIAFYMAADGEIDPSFLMTLASSAGKTSYLPALHPTTENKMVFLPWRPGDKLVPNRFGINEPRWRRPTPTWMLDVVCLPLVAFDRRGNRLGMGGGFYDRAFEDRQDKPLLIGLAHHSQEVDALPQESWDIPLDGIATDKTVTLFNN